ncbi:hypothetical protein J4440_06600 [Candidatus Woesearchaeota archaeon]|nr:hypothetical protein [Candidatus Woesearchaeota archaeon]
MKNIINSTKEGFGVGVLIKGNRCYRCEHFWVPRDENKVATICPSCKSPYWKTPKTRFKKGEKKR